MIKGHQWLTRVLLPLLAIPLVLLSLLLVLLGTAGGTQWLLKQSLDYLNSPQLSIHYADSDGAFFEGLSFTGLVIEMSEQKVVMQQLNLSWQPAALFDGVVQINHIYLQNLKVDLPENSEPSTQPLVIPDIQLPVQIVVQDFLLDGFYLPGDSENPLIEKVHLMAVAKLDGIALTLHEFKGMQAQADAVLSMSPIAPHAVNGRVNLQALIDEVGDIDLNVDLKGLALRPEIALTVNLPAAMSARAKLDLTELLPRFDVQLNSPGLQWPLQGDIDYQLDDLSMSVSGNASAYALTLNSAVHGRDMPSARLSLNGKGSDKKISLLPLKAEMLEGVIQATGEVVWLPDLRWDLVIVAEQINPGSYQADWSGLLDTRLKVSGVLQDDQPAVDVIIEELKGVLREFPVDAGGVLAFKQQALTTDDLQFRIGDNHVLINGSMQEQLAFSLDVDAANLSQLHPDFAGNINGKLQLTGTLQQPQWLAELQGNALVLAGRQIRQLTVDGDWKGRDGNMTMLASDVFIDGNRLNVLTLSVNGDLMQHQIDVSGEGLGQQLKLKLAGGYDGRLWQGQWLETQLDNEFVNLRQPEPAPLKVAADLFSMDKWCLQGNDESLCLQADWQGASNKIEAQGQLLKLDLARLQPLLGTGMDVKGLLSGDFEVSGSLEQPVATLNIVPTDGFFTFKDEDETLQIPYRSARVKLDYRNDRAVADLGFELAENGKASGHFEMDKGPARTLSGQLNAALPDLRLVQGFVPDLQDVSGNLDVTLNLEGKIEQPIITGVFLLEDGKANLPAGGLELSDLQLRAEADGNQYLTLNGRVNSGEGYLQISGDIDAGKVPAYIDLSLRGERFQVARLPNADVEVSPDLKLVGRETFDITGELLVPKAVIEIYELPPSVDSVSSDEVIVDKQAPAEGRGRPVNADVFLQLGEQVSFSGFGLKTGLKGMLEAEYDGKQSRLFGRIEMQDAAYKAYGQNLQVEIGRLLFAGAPDNPGVDLKASRLSIDKETTAYLAVSGRLSQPKIRVYSEPSLSEAEALAYLITGRNLSQADREAGNEISAAALSLGLNKTLPALNEMGERLGIDEISFDGGSDGYEDSSLKIGKYLNPDFYIGYSQGLFDAEGALLLNYKINEYLELESLSGAEESVDLYYRHEHD